MNNKNYIIYAPSYNINSGGSIALHTLCHLINMLGENAFLWSYDRKRTGLISRFKNKPFTTNPSLNTPIANTDDLKNSIVIYPEVTAENPLNSSNVVRWFLHKPGYHTGKILYGRNELYFFYSKAFNDPIINDNPDNLLSILTINQEYKNLNNKNRTGSCYLIRKGKGKPLVHDLNNSILIDGMSHAEIAAVFNKSKFFYSYDEFTMYSSYAALCGCISIVIPSTFSNKSDWYLKNPSSKYGVAYGIDDLDHAKKNQHLVKSHLQSMEENSILTVKDFLIKTKKKFTN